MIENPKLTLHETSEFLAHLEKITCLDKGELPFKVSKYLNLFKCGLPLDPTVRYFPVGALEQIISRINQLSEIGMETWVSFAPADPIKQLVSIQRSTPLVKGVFSKEDYLRKVVPELEQLPPGTWVKLFYDTHAEELQDSISGAVIISGGSEALGEKREIAIGWANTSDVRLVDENHGGYIVWSPKDPTWKVGPSWQNESHEKRVASPQAHKLIRTIFGGPSGYFRKCMARLAQMEGRGSISFEFKIRPHHHPPIFFIDYEYAGNSNSTSFGWLFYGREGD